MPYPIGVELLVTIFLTAACGYSKAALAWPHRPSIALTEELMDGCHFFHHLS